MHLLSLSIGIIHENLSFRSRRSENRNLPSYGRNAFEIHCYDRHFFLKTKLSQNASHDPPQEWP
jgi:hypothetical protein